MTKTIKKATGANGNKLKFFTTSLLNQEHVIVNDMDSLNERVYIVGETQVLNDFKEVKIESVKQVMAAWSNGLIWF